MARSLAFPAPTGTGLLAFQDAFLRSAIGGEQLADMLQARRIRALQEAGLLRQEEQQQALPAAIQALLSTPQTTVPGTPTLTPAELLPGEVGAATSAPPPIETPGTPIPIGRSLTDALARMGPAGMQAALNQPAGQRALQMSGIVTDEELERRRRGELAKRDITRLQGEARAAYLERYDVLGGLQKEGEIWTKLLDLADPAKPEQMAQIETHRKAALDKVQALVEDKAEGQRLARDWPRVASSFTAFQQSGEIGDFVNFVQATTQSDSRYVKGFAGKIFDQMAKGMADEFANPTRRAFMVEVGKSLKLAADAGQAITPIQAMKSVYAADPTRWAQAANDIMLSKDVSNEMKHEFYGVPVTPGGSHDAALTLAYARATAEFQAKGQPFNPRGVQETQLVQQYYTDIKQGSRDASMDQAVWLSLHQGWERQAREARTDLQKLQKDLGDPRVSGLPESKARVEQEIRAKKKEVADLEGLTQAAADQLLRLRGGAGLPAGFKKPPPTSPVLTAEEKQAVAREEAKRLFPKAAATLKSPEQWTAFIQQLSRADKQRLEDRLNALTPEELTAHLGRLRGR